MSQVEGVLKLEDRRYESLSRADFSRHFAGKKHVQLDLGLRFPKSGKSQIIRKTGPSSRDVR